MRARTRLALTLVCATLLAIARISSCRSEPVASLRAEKLPGRSRKGSAGQRSIFKIYPARLSGNLRCRQQDWTRTWFSPLFDMRGPAEITAITVSECLFPKYKIALKVLLS